MFMPPWGIPVHGMSRIPLKTRPVSVSIPWLTTIDLATDPEPPSAADLGLFGASISWPILYIHYQRLDLNDTCPGSTQELLKSIASSAFRPFSPDLDTDFRSLILAAELIIGIDVGMSGTDFPSPSIFYTGSSPARTGHSHSLIEWELPPNKSSGFSMMHMCGVQAEEEIPSALMYLLGWREEIRTPIHQSCNARRPQATKAKAYSLEELPQGQKKETPIWTEKPQGASPLHKQPSAAPQSPTR